MRAGIAGIGGGVPADRASARVVLANVGYDKANGGTVEKMVVGVSEGDIDFVGPRGQPNDDQRLTAGVSPVPGSIVKYYVNVTDPWRDVKCVWAENRFNAEVFGSILNENLSFR